MSDTWFTPEEVIEYTGKTRWKAQCRKLAEMGVEFTPNGVGRPLVSRAKYAPDSITRPGKRKAEPNWSAISGKAA